MIFPSPPGEHFLHMLHLPLAGAAQALGPRSGAFALAETLPTRQGWVLFFQPVPEGRQGAGHARRVHEQVTQLK